MAIREYLFMRLFWVPWKEGRGYAVKFLIWFLKKSSGVIFRAAEKYKGALNGLEIA